MCMKVFQCLCFPQGKSLLADVILLIKFKMEPIQDEEQEVDYIKDFTKAMPKVELHAHLNGSLSKQTIAKLYDRKNRHKCKEIENFVFPDSLNSFSECFKIFELIHALTDNPEAIYTATEDVIKEFYNDGVRYLELRSTPKEIPGYMSRSDYVEAMTSAIKNVKQNLPNINVKLILSIDRKNNSILTAEETVKIAEAGLKSSSDTIVGIDLSGDANTKDVLKFIPVLLHAKKVGLKLALHVAEVPDRDEEVEKLLQLQPDRIGHGTFIHPLKGGCEKNFHNLKKMETPLEMCLTSNVFCHTATSYKDHHFPLWREINHPCIICTDDKGVFNTTLSEEYYLAQRHYSLTPEDLWELSYNSINHSFANQREKEQLQEYWRKQKESLFQLIPIET